MKKLSVLLMATAALGLTACGANKSTSKAKDASSKNKSTLIVHKHKAKGTLSANNISPQENVDLITVYAANKYRGAWQNTLKNAEQDALNVSLIQRDDDVNYRG